MNALDDTQRGATEGRVARAGGTLSIRETSWGFKVRLTGAAERRASRAELAMKVFGILMLPAGVAVSISLQPVAIGALAATTTAMPLAFFAVGLAIFLHAHRGFRREVQIDSSIRAVRIGVTNASGRFHEQQRYPARDIDAAFLIRSTDRPSRLCLRRRQHNRPVRLIEGDERVLQVVLERTAQALKAPGVRRREVSGRRSRMSLPLWKKRSAL